MLFTNIIFSFLLKLEKNYHLYILSIKKTGCIVFLSSTVPPDPILDLTLRAREAKRRLTMPAKW
jgi:hypothetical protein